MSNANNSSNSNSRYAARTLDDICTNESRGIRPLKPVSPCTLPIVVVRPDRSVLSEITGQIITFEQYAEQLRRMPRHLVVTYSADAWLWLLNERWQGHRLWTWQVMVQKKTETKIRHHVTYYGFRDPARKKPFTNLVIDAGSFTNDRDADLMALGKWVREFCNSHGLALRASAAGVAAQLLRHADFYPEARRMVPKFVNDTAREHLPGPFYERYADAVQEIEAAMYIDQETAYHHAALTTPLPNANSVHATGHTRSLRTYARAGSELFEREMHKHGLICADVEMPTVRPEDERYLPRALREPGRRHAWLWTNELPYLRSLGLQVHALVSVWGTAEVDLGIRRYAEYAQKLSKTNPHLKALLLMPYGALGKRPGTIEIHTPGGEDELLLAGRWIEGTRSRPVNLQTYTANALQLGLIQSHVRALSLDMARQLRDNGQEIISVYADGIFVRLDANGQMPMFAPWRLKEDCLELHLSASLRAPVRGKVKREYMSTSTEGGIA